MSSKTGNAMSAPALSVIVVTPDRFRNIRRTVHHLRAQTARRQIELVIVAPSIEAVEDRVPAETEGFGAVRIVPAGPIPNVDLAAAEGVLRASAPVVAIVEDHAFPEPEWVAALIEAHQGPWAAVGSVLVNANPGRMLSWTNLLLAYGWYLGNAREGPAATLPAHNVSFKREVLLPYGDRLPARFGRAGGLLDDLKAQGHRFYLVSKARIAHVNPSTWASTAELRINAGRLYGATRARQQGWSPLRRLIYTLSAPLIPVIRLVRLRSELYGGSVPLSLYPALLTGVLLDAVGQMAGYAFGPGNSLDTLATFEMDRMQHITAAERAALAEPAPDVLAPLAGKASSSSHTD